MYFKVGMYVDMLSLIKEKKFYFLQKYCFSLISNYAKNNIFKTVGTF